MNRHKKEKVKLSPKADCHCLPLLPFPCVWNAIAKAEGVGVKIFSVRGKGYKLQQPISLLNEKIIQNAMGEEGSWFNIKVLDSVESTNSYLSKVASLGYPHALAIAFQIETRETLKCLAITSPEWNFPSARNSRILNKRFAKRITLLK